MATLEIINTGYNANDGTGDPLRTAFEKSNTNFGLLNSELSSIQLNIALTEFVADAAYPVGTVVKFGGDFDVTIAAQDHDPLVAGVIAVSPMYEVNPSFVGETTVKIALFGKALCNVTGPVTRGQMLVSAGNGRARAETSPAAGTVVGKALDNFSGVTGSIEILVGRA
jgi:hypothetical protein